MKNKILKILKNGVPFLLICLFGICFILLIDSQAKTTKRSITSVAIVGKNEVILMKKDSSTGKVIVRECKAGEQIQKKNDCDEKEGTVTALIDPKLLRFHMMTALALNEFKIDDKSKNKTAATLKIEQDIEKYIQLKKVGSSTYNLDQEMNEMNELQNIVQDSCDNKAPCAQEKLNLARLKELKLKLSTQRENISVIESVNKFISQLIDRTILGSELFYYSNSRPSLVYHILSTYTRPQKPNFEFAKIVAGEVTLTDRLPEEKSKATLKVLITKDFEITKTEVTQLQWFSLMGYNPSFFKKLSDCPTSYIETTGTDLRANFCADHPVENVSWKQIQVFVDRVNAFEPTHTYRLPTEAEWQMAASGGKQTDYFFGSNSSLLDEYAWYAHNSNQKTSAVAQKKPNPFGLYDMYGNVSEWVQDSFDRLPSGTSTDFVAQSENYLKGVRGGNYSLESEFSSSTMRLHNYDFDPAKTVGFRLVRIAKK